MSSDNVITIRISKEEKDQITQKAKEYFMSVNQYAKFKLLEEKSDFLNKNVPLIMRIMISGYMHVRSLGIKHLTKEELNRIHQDSEEEFRKLNIQKDGRID